jgi:hypothetical protein
MGMFDYIRCEVPLPDGWQQDELQTKDFCCEMVEHVITADGRLMLDQGHWEAVPKSERPHPNDDGIMGLAGSIRRVGKMVDANYHGIVNFYGLETIRYEPDERYGSRGRPIYKNHEYLAKFTDGRLVEITVAQAIEAGTAETGTGSVHESAVGEADAPVSRHCTDTPKES